MSEFQQCDVPPPIETQSSPSSSPSDGDKSSSSPIMKLDELNQHLLNSIIHRFSTYQAKVIESLHFRNLSLKRSAVTLNLTSHKGKLYVLFTKRPIRKGDKWSGQVCFPGGKFEADKDSTLLDTAVRETMEEIGVDLRGDGNDSSGEGNFQLLGRVDDHLAQENMPVSCFVFYWKDLQKVKYNLNASEVDGMRWFPLENFLATHSIQQRNQTKQLDKAGNLSSSTTSVLTFSIGLVYPNLKRTLQQFSIHDVNTYFPCIKIESRSINNADFEKPQLEFILWGLTLRILSSFLRIIDQSLPLMNYDYDFGGEWLGFMDWFRRNYSKLDQLYLRRFYRNYNACEHSKLPILHVVPAPTQEKTQSVDSKSLLLERLSKL